MKHLTALEKSLSHKVKENEYSFASLLDYSRKEILSIFKAISKQVAPIYGGQKETFLKFLKGGDRDNIILEHRGKPIGILVFKNTPQREEITLQHQNGYLEIKSLFLFDQFGAGHIRKLWEFLIEQIKERYPTIDGLYASVSKNKANASLHMFEKLGFEPLYEAYNKYRDNGDSEVYLYLPINIERKKKTLELSVNKSDFSALLAGEKTSILRSGKAYEHYSNGDRIRFSNGGTHLQKKIKKVIKYQSLADYIEGEGIRTPLLGAQSIKEANGKDQQHPGEKEKTKPDCSIVFRF